MGDVSYVMEKDALEYCTYLRHEANMDHLLFRFGRLVDPDLDEILYVQVVALDVDDDGNPESLLVCRRGCRGRDSWFNVPPDAFTIASKIEYILDFGVGEPEARHSSITRWGIQLKDRVGKVQDIDSLLGHQKSHPKVSIDFLEMLTFLSTTNEPLTICPEDYLNTYVFGDPPTAPTIVVKTGKATKTSKPKIKVARSSKKKPSVEKKAAPAAKIKKTLFSTPAPSTKVNSESEVESDHDSEYKIGANNDPSDSSDPDSSDEDVVDKFKIKAAPARRKSKGNSENKYGIRMTEYQEERCNAIFKPTLFRGKWPTLSIEARADRLHGAERKRGVYEVTKTAIQSFMQGNMGIDTISYYMPYDKVPLSEKQSLPMEKWTTTVAPRKWVRTMKELDSCFYVMNEMCSLYLRLDVAAAVTVVYKRVNYFADTNFPVHAVNAYRDLYCGALSGIVDSAVDGLKGDKISDRAREDCSPNSEAYITTITNRQHRVDDGRSWGITPGKPSGNRNSNVGSLDDGNDTSAAKNPKGGGMTEVQKSQVPIVNGRSICLANLSLRGCKRADACTYLHDESQGVPHVLDPYFKKRFGAKK